MEKRTLGKTGLRLSILGMGGFHLVEASVRMAETLLNRYLDSGGNYLETAADYGDGLSEVKIGKTVSHRRNEYFLATKCSRRTRTEAMASLEQSLRHLKTDHVDILFMHHVQTETELAQTVSEDGALAAAKEAKRQGKVRFIGITGHGRPEALIPAMEAGHFDVMMTHFNYFDRFNFPEIENVLLPKAVDRNTGVLAMKVVGDGYLYRSPEPAIRYALSLPVASLVMGINREEDLETDLDILSRVSPMTDAEKEEWYRNAPELGDTVCRQCGACDEAGQDIRPSEIFLMEGMFDRQMDSGRVPGAADYALQERLKHWFDQKCQAMRAYAACPGKVDPERDYTPLNTCCPYGIDIDRKLKYAHFKLTGDDPV